MDETATGPLPGLCDYWPNHKAQNKNQRDHNGCRRGAKASEDEERHDKEKRCGWRQRSSSCRSRCGRARRHPLVRLGTSQPALASIIGARRSAMDHAFGPSSRGIEGTWQTCHKGERKSACSVRGRVVSGSQAGCQSGSDPERPTLRPCRLPSGRAAGEPTQHLRSPRLLCARERLAREPPSPMPRHQMRRRRTRAAAVASRTRSSSLASSTLSRSPCND